jgi:hypothetical protein
VQIQSFTVFTGTPIETWTIDFVACAAELADRETTYLVHSLQHLDELLDGERSFLSEQLQEQVAIYSAALATRTLAQPSQHERTLPEAGLQRELKR